MTVRAFSAERRFLNSLFGKIDLTTKVRGVLLGHRAFDVIRSVLDVVFVSDFSDFI